MPLVAWEDKSTAICDRIRSTRGTLKIVLKTKDDPYFLADWAAHHRQIVGDSNLIIFDNGSSDAKVLSIYENLVPDLLVARFGGFHNDLHNANKFESLYASLSASSDFFCFLDTDEFLTFYDGERFIRDAAMLDRLKDKEGGAFIPSTWLYNAPSYRDRMLCGTELGTLRHGLAWGKPLIRSAAAPLSGEVNHNCQIAKGKKAPAAWFGFFLLHMATLSPAQRVRANMNKLIARGFLQSGDSVEKALERDLSRATENEKLYVTEIKRLLSLREDPGSELAPLGRGSMRIEQSGKVEFASPDEARVFAEFGASFGALCAEMLPS
ncbi:glycosyltransferase family 2 protein [Bradyrhizobium sp. B097]|uniref:glycosyltransferase family 2 protein n=1 Tax=Bradyrhizobium sp. B097 TaxID=3140244 RepID=UPI003182F7B0